MHVNWEILMAESRSLCWSHNKQYSREEVPFSHSQASRSAWRAILLQLSTHQHNDQIPALRISQFTRAEFDDQKSWACVSVRSRKSSVLLRSEKSQVIYYSHASQTWTVLSSEPEAMRLLSGDHATLSTTSEWPL
jgi:hypothetical protein